TFALSQDDLCEISEPEPLPQFPIEALPSPLRELVEEGSKSLNVPHDYIAVPLLTICGAIMGNNYQIHLLNDHYEYPTLFTCVIGDSGTSKTPALNIARHPIEVLQKEAWDRTDLDQSTLDHLYTTDVTIEGLQKYLQTSPGVCIILDELISWLN